MYNLSVQIAVGPCLVLALASVAMFILSSTLARTRHARLWAVSFAIYTLQWALTALFHSAPTQSLLLFISEAATVAGLFAYFAGFLERAGRLSLRWLLIGCGGVSIVQICLMLTPPLGGLSPFGRSFLPIVRLLLLSLAAKLVTPRDREPSATERSVIGMLVVLAATNAGMFVIGLAQAHGDLPAGTFLSIQSMLSTPAAAALGLFTLMLIASDFSRERLRLIHTDPLTGVLNRLGLEEGLARMIARARPPRRPLSLILTDVDRFKLINDRHGHLIGDAALISFAHHLGIETGGQTLVGRFGGEEFAVVLEGHGAESAGQLAEQIRADLVNLTVPGTHPVSITASFGVAELLPGETANALYGRADAALYLSKQEGRNCTTIDPSRAA